MRCWLSTLFCLETRRASFSVLNSPDLLLIVSDLSGTFSLSRFEAAARISDADFVLRDYWPTLDTLELKYLFRFFGFRSCSCSISADCATIGEIRSFGDYTRAGVLGIIALATIVGC